MIDVIFKNRGEIRMGSPFNTCDIELSGQRVPELPKQSWQDIFAVSDDKRFLALVSWDTPGNSPGFRIVTIDSNDGTYKVSQRMDGCCERIWWAADGDFKVEVFRV